MWKPTIRYIHDGGIPRSNSGPATNGALLNKTRKQHTGVTISIRRVHLEPESPFKATSELSTEAEELYRYWLSRRVYLHKPRPCIGIASHNPSDLMYRIPVQFRESPLLMSTTVSDRTDVTTAHACLFLHVSRSR